MTQLRSVANVQWIGKSYNWPPNGQLSCADRLWINTETYPINSAGGVEVAFSINGGTWCSTPLTRNGTSGNNDRWHADLGKWPSGTSIQYALKASGANELWDNNGGRDFYARVGIAQGDISSAGLGWNGYQATVSVKNPTASTRCYILTTNQPGRRDATRTSANGGSYPVDEQPGQPVIRTGHDLFDALFALAYHEMGQLSVDGLVDADYNGGNWIRCPVSGSGGCFRTGFKWPYAWTRDSAYAVDLAMAALDPLRSMNTLLFKTSPRRTGPSGAESAEIVQDTGSGGSWPVSTDRVVWARGAWELLKYLTGETRRSFAERAYTAIANTAESDRIAAYDDRDGLYRGETSFLDWREQTYPSWTATDVVHIGMSKTLSTNVNHWKILDVAARMASELGKADAVRYRDWADRLKTAINAELWLEDAGLYSMGKLTELDPSPTQRFELLGQALAIVDGIADSAKASSILRAFPHTVGGAPVVWPAVRERAIYHNGAVWPFVSAYLVKAASLAGNDAVVNTNLCAMMRGAALNLSHMENYRFIDLDGRASDTNSEAQLWSVAGYMNTVLDVIFGRHATQGGILFRPFITKLIRNQLFATADSLELSRLRYRDRLLNVTVKLPPPDDSTIGYYRVERVLVDGVVHAIDTEITESELDATSQVIIELTDASAPGGQLTLVEDNGDWRRFWAPFEPKVDPRSGVRLANGRLTVHWDANGETGTVFDIYRNGRLVASQVSGSSWLDPDSGEPDSGDPDSSEPDSSEPDSSEPDFGNRASTALCYAVAQRYVGSYPVSNVSHHSEPVCYGEVETILVNDPRVSVNDGTRPIIDHGRSSYSDWGHEHQTMDIALTPAQSGIYLVQLLYGNAFNWVGQGITNCVKLVEVLDARDQLVTKRVVMMPQRASWDDWGKSSILYAELKAGEAYRFHISDHYNMSYLASNAAYGHAGGEQGAINRANISGVAVRRVSAPG